jgi:isoleucyl-tRNA synthetase
MHPLREAPSSRSSPTGRAGLVYRDLKPVHWSIANQTALAEAELEYKDREDISVYVNFEVADPKHWPRSSAVR